jgi:hypothetical protein
LDAAGDRAGPSAGNDTLKKRLLDHIVQYYPAIAGNITRAPQLRFYF